MSFSEKLVQLRKREKMSQEQLAALLDVTRQSVSKWESGQTYPEMDKLLALCKIFKCSLDDLTNDEVTTVKIGDKKKGNLNNFIDSILEFIEKVYHMFRRMSAGEIIKCFFVMGCIALGLFIFRIPFSILEESVSSLFYNFGVGALVRVFIGLFNLMVDICFFILYILVFVYLFKLIYLDSYEEVEVVKETPKEKETESKEVKQPMVVERRKDKSYVFFDMLGKGAVLFIKGMICCFSFPFVISLFLISAGLIIALILIFKGILYIGVILGALFSLILNLLVLEVVFNFLTNRKNSKRMLITLMIGIIGLGLSFGIFMIEGAMTQYIDTVPTSEKASIEEKVISMTDDLAIFWMHDYNTTYKIDETLGNQVKIQVKYYKNYSKISFAEEDIPYYFREDVSGNESMRRIFDYLLKDLSKKKLYNYSKLFDTEVTISATSENISKIKENLEKFEKEQEEVRKQNEQLEQQKELQYYQNEMNRLETENERLKIEIENKEIKIEEYQTKLKEYKENLQSIITE